MEDAGEEVEVLVKRQHADVQHQAGRQNRAAAAAAPLKPLDQQRTAVIDQRDSRQKCDQNGAVIGVEEIAAQQQQWVSHFDGQQIV